MGQGDPGGQHQAGMTRTRWHAAPLGGKREIQAPVRAKELVALQPDVILAQGTPCCAQTGDADDPDCIYRGSSQTAR